MNCKYEIRNLGGREVDIDCIHCKYGASLSDPTCLKNVLAILRKERVSRIKFGKGDYMEIYNEEDINPLLEIIEIAENIEEEKPWEDLKGMMDPAMEKEAVEFLQELPSTLHSNPIKCYEMLSSLLNRYFSKKRGGYRIGKGRGLQAYSRILKRINSRIEKSKLIQRYKEGKTLNLIKPMIQPAFISTYINLKIPKDFEVLEDYKVLTSRITIYGKEKENIYFVNPSELWLSPEQIRLLTGLRDRVVKESSTEIIEPTSARGYFKKKALENLAKVEEELTKEERERLAEIFARYTAGYGLLEVLFMDSGIQDIYIDSPPGSTPIYIGHEKYGNCNTNLYPDPDELEKLSSKFRAIGERPFDEGNPLLDMQLRDIGIRVAGVQSPSTFEGIAYVFRKHRERPWTLPRFVEMGMFSSRAAALLSLLITGECSMLITGGRGTGKTSLLSSMMAEIDQQNRIILMEDTPEIPFNPLRKEGWKIQQLRNQPPISRKKGYELSPEENLRAALRLGESVLILGEVRGTEAKALFEAMRVGAAGNSVLGTIHGSNPYDTWDRIVNDLQVPTNSFKAVDVIISLNYRTDLMGETQTKTRRLAKITELRKNWRKDPEAEGAFFDLMNLNSRGMEEFNTSDSYILKMICERIGVSVPDLMKILDIKRSIIEDIIARKNDELLELEHITQTNKKFKALLAEKKLEEVLPAWREWFSNYVKKIEET